MGGHCIDLLEMFFGSVVKVSCFINNNVHDYKSEDSAVAMLFFENGALGTVDTFFCIPDNSSKNILELYGSRSSILAKGTIGQAPAGKMVAFLEQDSKDYDAQQARPVRNSTMRKITQKGDISNGARTEGQGMIIAPEPVNTYQAEIKEFSQAIIDDREPFIGGELGLPLRTGSARESLRTAFVCRKFGTANVFYGCP